MRRKWGLSSVGRFFLGHNSRAPACSPQTKCHLVPGCPGCLGEKNTRAMALEKATPRTRTGSLEPSWKKRGRQPSAMTAGSHAIEASPLHLSKLLFLLL